MFNMQKCNPVQEMYLILKTQGKKRAFWATSRDTFENVNIYQTHHFGQGEILKQSQV